MAKGRLRTLLAALLLLCLSAIHVLVNPYTKVEESFTIQAVHDILTYGVRPSALPYYDHQVYPGAVPRSFFGPLLLAALTYPSIALTRSLGWCTTSAHVQALVRWTLSSMYSASLFVFASAVLPRARAIASTDVRPVGKPQDEAAIASGAKLSLTTLRSRGKTAASPSPSSDAPKALATKESGRDPTYYFFVLLTCVQFHCNFWGGRTAPNSIAFPFVTFALALLLKTCDPTSSPSSVQRGSKVALSLLTFSAVILRSEVVGILAPACLWILLHRRLTFLAVFATGLYASFFSILATTLVDSYFWQQVKDVKAKSLLSAFSASMATRGRPLWPELEAILFNVVEGKSSEWGVSPFHAYFSSHLPKLLSFSTPLLLIGTVSLLRTKGGRDKASLLLALPTAHITLLSMLGHKEWRFIIYCMPLLNTVSAVGAVQCLQRQNNALVRMLPVAVIGLTFASTVLATYISHLNYPGGEALALLHNVLDTPSGRNQDVNLHIDVLSAMTGVTLFQSIRLPRDLVPPPAGRIWKYDKAENLPTFGASAGTAWEDYTHLLTEQPECRIFKRIPNLELLGLPDTATSSQIERADFATEPLPDDEQPFRPLMPPVRAYAGLGRKSAGRYIADLKATLRAPLALHELLPRLLPVEIRMEDRVWLCVRKQATT